MRVLLIAGNGFIGAHTASRLVREGVEVGVHHTGRTDVPAGVAAEFIALASDPPIVEIPEDARAFAADVVVHFYCMGTPDAAALITALDGVAKRLVLVSSCDVYRAYGRFIGLEPGPPDGTPIDEDGALRTTLHPYRDKAMDTAHLLHWYDKVEAERGFLAARASEVCILRLPKVYGPDTASPLGTVYGYAHQPRWRWTHGHVENVAAAIALAAMHPKAAGEVFNAGEAVTPTMGERLARLPERKPSDPPNGDYNFAQDLHFSTNKIRSLLGFRDVIDEREAMLTIMGG